MAGARVVPRDRRSTAALFQCSGDQPVLCHAGDLNAAYEACRTLLQLGQSRMTAILVPAYHALAVPMYYLGEFERARRI